MPPVFSTRWISPSSIPLSTALLTIYDMCKAVDKGMELGEIHLEKKSGGKSGLYIRAEGGYV